ncbi:MAG: SDR family oxidoreductase [Spirosomataceae bacterium]
MKISILGCGWLGFPLAKSLEKQGHTIKGTTTHAEKLNELRKAGIEPFWLQLLPEPKGIGWDYFLDCDVLIVNIPPRLAKSEAGFHVAQIQHLLNMLKNSPVEQLIYINSTSVYPDLNREVAEEDVIIPEQSAAPALIQVEQILKTLPQNTLILRCGGLMGYERIPAKYVAGKQGITTGDVPVNYVHRDDVIGIIDAFLNKPTLWNDTYNVVAPLHPTRRAVYLASTAPFGYEPPTFQSTENMPFKVISSQKLLAALDYSFIYSNPLDFKYGME